MGVTPQIVAAAADTATDVVRYVFTMGIDIADRLAENVDARIDRKIKARMARISIRRARRQMRADTRALRRERRGK